MTMTLDAPVRAKRPWVALAVLMIPVLLVSIDNTVLSFALPMISAELHPTGTQLLWMVDIYPLMLAGLLVAMGSIGDRLGRRRLLLVGAVGFGAASGLAATASSAEMLIMARALLGFFGATLMPSTLSLIRNIFHADRDRRLAIATWAAMFGGGAALGPVVGGWLLQHAHWGWVFLINIPLIMIFVPMALLLVPESRDPAPGRFDPMSIVLSMLTMGPAVYAIKHGLHVGFDTLTVALMTLSVGAGWQFVRRQRRSTSPMLDIRLFGNRVFRGAVLANMLSLMSLAGFLFCAAQLLQLDIGLSPMRSAMVLVPGMLVSMVLGFCAVHLVEHLPVRILVPGALLITAAGFVLLGLAGEPSVATVLIAFVAMAIGLGVAETLTNDLIMASVPAGKAGAASAISETAYELGSVLGTAVLGSLLTATYRAQLRIPDVVSAAGDDERLETLGGTLELAASQPGEVGGRIADAARTAFDAGVQVSSVAAVLIMVLAAVVTRRSFRGI